MFRIHNNGELDNMIKELLALTVYGAYLSMCIMLFGLSICIPLYVLSLL